MGAVSVVSLNTAVARGGTMTSASGSRLITVRLIIRAVAGERGHGPFDLVEQWAYLGRIINIVRRQRSGDNLARVSVHADMQLPP
jgi:hypothetical protein